MAVIDVISYNGERDLFEIRYNILKEYVDEFIVVEFDRTFSGKDKPAYFLRDFPEYAHTYFHFSQDHYHQYMELAEASPNTQGAAHWKTEFCQKESIKDALTHLTDDDIVFIGDCDEIWDSSQFSWVEDPLKLKLKVYTYYLNNRSTEEFWGTLVSKYRDIKDVCLNHIRTNAQKTVLEHGWHFTSMGGYEAVHQKLSDSYTEESYWTPMIQQTLKKNLESSKDFLGRDFTYILDESELPQYLLDNREKYLHLFK